MSTTNDEQAPYGKQEQRAPMLSDEEITNAVYGSKSRGDHSYVIQLGIELGRNHYESLITKGVLRVVKKANNNGSPSVFYCSSCKFLVDGQNGIPVFNFCPGCGAQIVK